MSDGMPQVPPGSGQHPICLVVLAARDPAASRAFYQEVFGWSMQALSADVTAFTPPGGPAGSLRANLPEGFQGTVPFIAVSDVPAMLARVTAAGGTVEREPWKVPMVGTMARFRDPSGTLYGLAGGFGDGRGVPHVPMPFGANPKPAPNTFCSLEMYAADGQVAGRFFGDLFGWNALPTMPRFVAFDAGAGIGGVFQSHTPQAPGMSYVYVTDVGTTLAAIEAAGGKRMGDPMAMPGMGTFGYFLDPSGTAVGLIGP